MYIGSIVHVVNSQCMRRTFEYHNSEFVSLFAGIFVLFTRIYTYMHITECSKSGSNSLALDN